MKKILSALAALAVCGMLTACGNSAADENVASADETTASEATTVVVTETTIATEETTVSNETTTVSEETTTASETTTEASIAEETTVTEEETVATTTEQTETEPATEEEIVIDDNADEITVNSSFADMDEFLTADLFMLDGKTATADTTLSADIFDTLDGNFYLETSDLNGNSPFKLAIKGDMIMVENEFDGSTHKMVIRDSKAYTLDHENMVALFLPADKELISQYTPEKLGIIPENISKESFVIADVTIGGKAYKFEYSTSSDWAMLYTSDGKLYASVKSGDSLDCELCKFSVTAKIPSDAFTIPEDYFRLDLEEMMKNASTEETE